MSEQWKNEAWAQDIWYRGKVTRRRMIGWGGNIVALLPGGLTGIRLAKSGGTADNSEVDTGGMAQVADALSNFCP